MDKGPDKYTVIKEYISPYPNSIFFFVGERIKVGKKFEDDPNWKDWIWCEGENSNKAWVPEQFIEIKGKEGVLLQDYDALELSVFPGEVVSIYKLINGFGMGEKADGTKGWVPLKNLDKIRI
ncbi:MAG: hypothetical protein HON98_05495 [Chloroflexi bacterium]|jgi:hypothetical protein|nr:hypothetical protein [Chloroflexota bacterium]MBT3670152.1 hypothetical protein [Chloroflexota bacterium]MBT4004021.1 hypothetical protein [Chloroflexota bacterium]MBT4306174.1 hypothetical protein [Chloroflexota bacterium]MBT4534554.1 hypothetical protein [Chloroflexota bacterium]